jgi:hypothetical protein
MQRFLRYLLHDERGSELLEAALTLPLVMLVTLAIVNLGMAVYAGQMAQAAARHGARMGSVAQQNAAGIAAGEAAGFANGAFGIGNPQVSILAPGGVVGSIIKVRVDYTVPNLLSGFGFPGLPRGPFKVHGEATFRQEGW